MKINFTRKVSRDTFYSVTPINWLLRITSLSNIYRNGIQLAQSGSVIKHVIYIISFGLLNIFFLFHKTKSFVGSLETGLIKFGDVVQLTYWLSYFEYVVDIYFVYKFGRERLLKYFETFDRIDTMLGFYWYDNIRRIIVTNTVFFLLICFFSSIFDFLAWGFVEGWGLTAIYSVDYIYFFLNVLTVLDVVSHVIQVEYRLKVLQDLLVDYNSTMTNSIKVVKVDKFLTANKQVIKHLEKNWFTRCYLLLLEQVYYINTSYGWRILVYCFNFLINVMHFFNSALRLMHGTMIPTGKNVPSDHVTLLDVCLPIMSCISRAVSYEIMVIILINRYEQIYRQTELILDTIDKILCNKKSCDDMKTNLLEFRNLFITRPIKFHAANFFSINYSLFVSLNSVVVTYTIIMLHNMQ